MEGGRVDTLTPRGRWFDAGVAALLLLLSLILFVPFVSKRADPWILGLALSFLVVHSGALAWRRARPVPAFWTSVVSGGAFLLLDYPLPSLGLTALVAVYTFASLRPTPISLPGLAAVVTLASAAATFGSNADATTAIGNAIVLTVAWYLGTTGHQRRLDLARLEERTKELEEARDELAHTAVTEERLRIARELHDVMAHSMSMIAVQSGVGAHVIDHNPEEAKCSLQVIEKASNSALEEIRRVIGIARNEGDGAALRPSPALSDLPDLAEAVARSGPAVDLQMDASTLHDLGTGLQLTSYRIVQEALTNVVKHAHAERARVVVMRHQDGLSLEITDDGRGGSADASGGSGLTGMREWVALHSGTLEAGPLPEGGWRVRVRIPLGEPE